MSVCTFSTWERNFQWGRNRKGRMSVSKLPVKLSKTFFPSIFYKNGKFLFTKRQDTQLSEKKSSSLLSISWILRFPLTCLTPSIHMPHPHPRVYLPTQNPKGLSVKHGSDYASCSNSEMTSIHLPFLVPPKLSPEMLPKRQSSCSNLIRLPFQFSSEFQLVFSTSLTSIFISPYILYPSSHTKANSSSLP